MKKKLTAVVTTAAMLAGMMPMAAVADEAVPAQAEEAIVAATNGETETQSDISVYVANFDTASKEDVQVVVAGDGVKKNQLLSIYLNDELTPLYSGLLTANEVNVITIKRSDITSVDDAYAGNVLKVRVTSPQLDTTYFAKTYAQAASAVAPTKMVAALDETGDGPKNRVVSVYFDEKYVPDSTDYVYTQAYDKNGAKAGTARYTKLYKSYFDTDVDENGLRKYEGTINYNADSDAETLLVYFVSDDEIIDTFNTKLQFASKYGDYKALELSFGDNVVVAGEEVEGTLTYVNTKNERYDITDTVNDTYTYDAATGVVANKNSYKPYFTVSKDAKLGETIKVTVSYNGHSASTTLTVTDGTKANTGKVTASMAPINKDTTITLQVLNSNGTNGKLSFQPKYFNFRWVDSSDKNAKVTLSTGNPVNITKNGTYVANIKSNKACTGYIEMIFSDDSGNVYKMQTNKFTFTDPSVVEKHKVTMTINSKTMTVDGATKTTDAAPVISQDRTFVPLRALSEAFGADVEWKTDNSIIIDYNDTKIVMNVGKTSFTVNGKTKTMDVAPYIVADAGRAMVPVRFISEALGFTVTPSYNTDGTTKSVSFAN